MAGFTFVSGNLGLDLAGTVQHRRADRCEMLESPADLGIWAVEAGILDRPCEVTPDGLAAARQLREAVYRLAAGTALPGDRELVNRVAAGPPVRVAIGADGRIERGGDLAAVLSTVARQAVELLGGPHAARIKECGADVCTRLYVDTSRGNGRRWCDMRECGNRAKAAHFRARHHG
ncbi:CGNR zinc finger domain-containing protein [Nonomuraea sp. NPDC050383]|uniref:CGNR zinc finger domain-containing protein n=1 Tax=Nonomuraea sp. NPDC050383 TaxID=3364362 RepID=UPI00378FD906